MRRSLFNASAAGPGGAGGDGEVAKRGDIVTIALVPAGRPPCLVQMIRKSAPCSLASTYYHAGTVKSFHPISCTMQAPVVLQAPS